MATFFLRFQEKGVLWNTAFHHVQSRFLIWVKEGSGYLPVRLFRNYAAFSLVVVTALLVSLTNFTHGRGTPGFLSGVVVAAGQHRAPRLAAQESKQENLSLVSLASAPNSIDPNQKSDASVFEETALSPENQMFLAAAVSSNIARDPEEDGGVRIYTVLAGDTVSGIAAKNGISVNTILWANDLDNVDSIKPGDQIFILPVAGFTYTVAAGDTIDSISAKYHSNKGKIIAFNGLPANGELSVGETIVIPDGQKALPPSSTPDASGLARRQYATAGGGAATDITPDFSRPKEGKVGAGHRFPYGYCTWYVAQKRFVPWGGNAGTWLFNARALGYKTGKTPTVGSIVVTTENRYYGHVAYVEKVSASTITVSEMNYVGWGKKSTRQLARTSRVIKGYIY